MSGGYLRLQKSGEHQVVIFTFAGEISRADKERWDQAVLELKQMFGPKVMGVTLKGDPTPAKFKNRARK